MKWFPSSRPRPLAAFALLVSASLVSASLVTIVFAQRPSAGAPFTREERRRLVAGELVRRPETRQEGGETYIGGTSWQRVHAPRERVWEVISDVANYARIIPGVETATLVEDHGDRKIIFLRHRYSFVSASYYATVRLDRRHWTVDFELDPSRPHDVRDGRGFLQLSRYHRTDTIVTWGVMGDVGSGILTGVFSSVIYDWILRVPWCVRGFVEEGHGVC